MNRDNLHYSDFSFCGFCNFPHQALVFEDDILKIGFNYLKTYDAELSAASW